MLRAIVLSVLLATTATSAQALVTFTPGSAASVAMTSPNAQLAQNGGVGANYTAYGVDFSYGNAEAKFNNPPLSFGGLNSEGVLDFFTNVDARIVLAGTLTQGVTNYLSLYAGSAEPGALKLTVYDTSMNIIGSAVNGPVLDANETSRLIVRATGIAYFSIGGNDSFGVSVVSLNNPTVVPVAGVIPEPSTWAMLVGGLGLVGIARRRRRTVAA